MKSKNNNSQVTNNTNRLFLALWPEVPIQTALYEWHKSWPWPSGATLVPKESLHLTLHFLGNVPHVLLPELMHGLQRSFHPFELSFSQPRAWTHGVVVVEPDSVPAALKELHASLKAALERLDIKTEARPFRPHITLARHSAGVSIPVTEQVVHWKVNQYALVQSQQKYHILRMYEGGSK